MPRLRRSVYTVISVEIRGLPGSQTPADMMRRIQELAPEASTGHVPDQHVVSKVILRRFVATDGLGRGKLYPFTLKYPDLATGPSGLRAAENHRLRRICLGLDDGTLLSSPEHMTTIKDAIALHFARSDAAWPW
jgi:hypothetical protein